MLRFKNVPLARLARPAPPRSSSVLISRPSSTSASPSPQAALEVADPLLLYYSLVAQGKVKKDEEQLRALVQLRKLHTELIDYQPPVHLLTLLESIRAISSPPSSSTSSVTTTSSLPAWPFKRSPLSNLGMGLSSEEEANRRSLSLLSEKQKTTELVKVLKAHEGLEELDTPKGFLLTGPPGTGKSLLMDLFFQSLPVPHKVRYHYHAFLLSLYQAIHRALERQRLQNEEEERAANELYKRGDKGGYPWSRKEEMKARAISQGWQTVFAGGRSASDPALNTREFVLAQVALDLIKTHGWLLAFDEVQLVDIAGAGLVSRVMSWYWRLGGVVVGTSNRVPEDLYKQGIQRATLSPFLGALAVRSPVINLSSPTDYRLIARSQISLSPETDAVTPGDFGSTEAWKRWGTRSRGWFVKGEDDAAWQDALRWVVGDAEGEKKVLSVYGRKVTVPWTSGGVARFSFKELCEKPLGPADYITLGSEFHTIVLDDVPVLPLNAKNEARRLITLLDAFYETKTRLLAFASAPIDSLFFPDAVTPEAPPPPIDAILDDLPTSFAESSGSHAPGDSGPVHVLDNSTFSLPLNDSLSAKAKGSSRYDAQDAAGEVTDSLVEEMLGDVQQDLDAPYRPNISAYDQSANVAAYERDAARQIETQAVEEQLDRQLRRRREQEARAPIHPSAATPSFQNLSIFTGEDERFSFKRAVSRVHEMSSAEYLVTAEHSPMPSHVRSWETPFASTSAVAAAAAAAAPPRHAVGDKAPLGDDRLSGVLDPADLRAKWPDGTPREGKEVDVRGERPVIREEHVWAMREDWGAKAGKWGRGAKAYEDDTK